MPPQPGTRSSAAYFLGGVSAGRYREISKPAATWHIVGFFQLFFFIAFSSLASPKGPALIGAIAGNAMAHPSPHKRTNETLGSQTAKTQEQNTTA